MRKVSKNRLLGDSPGSKNKVDIDETRKNTNKKNNELLHGDEVLYVCGKYRANRGLTYKNLFDASIWDPPRTFVGYIIPR